MNLRTDMHLIDYDWQTDPLTVPAHQETQEAQDSPASDWSFHRSSELHYRDFVIGFEFRNAPTDVSELPDDHPLTPFLDPERNKPGIPLLTPTAQPGAFELELLNVTPNIRRHSYVYDLLENPEGAQMYLGDYPSAYRRGAPAGVLTYPQYLSKFILSLHAHYEEGNRELQERSDYEQTITKRAQLRAVKTGVPTKITRLAWDIETTPEDELPEHYKNFAGYVPGTFRDFTLQLEFKFAPRSPSELPDDHPLTPFMDPQRSKPGIPLFRRITRNWYEYTIPCLASGIEQHDRMYRMWDKEDYLLAHPTEFPHPDSLDNRWDFADFINEDPTHLKNLIDRLHELHAAGNERLPIPEPCSDCNGNMHVLMEADGPLCLRCATAKGIERERADIIIPINATFQLEAHSKRPKTPGKPGRISLCLTMKFDDDASYYRAHNDPDLRVLVDEDASKNRFHGYGKYAFHHNYWNPGGGLVLDRTNIPNTPETQQLLTDLNEFVNNPERDLRLTFDKLLPLLSDTLYYSTNRKNLTRRVPTAGNMFCGAEPKLHQPSRKQRWTPDEDCFHLRTLNSPEPESEQQLESLPF